MEGCAVFLIAQDAGEAAVGGIALEVVTEAFRGFQMGGADSGFVCRPWWLCCYGKRL